MIELKDERRFPMNVQDYCKSMEYIGKAAPVSIPE